MSDPRAELEDLVHGKCDDQEITIPVRLVSEILREIDALIDLADMAINPEFDL